VRFLFYKSGFSWPRVNGHDIHTFEMMRALASLGHEVHVATATPVPERALAGLAAASAHVLDRGETGSGPIPGIGPLEERFRSYWGVPLGLVAAFRDVTSAVGPEVVVVSGLDVLPLLSGVGDGVRVWYAADEWCWHHLSQCRITAPSTWRELRQAAVKGIYERTFRRRIDRVWVVSETDAAAMRRVAGVRDVDVLANGVDADAFAPSAGGATGDGAIFWGRLDFGPNIQALEWFCERVWPRVLAARPGARFTVVGFNPGQRALALGRIPGVHVKPNVPDLRPEVVQHALVVLPFVSGGGIKNKLLEAAALGMPIVCSPRATVGLKGAPPVRVARSVPDWVSALVELWTREDARRDLGAAARTWVVREHTWAAAATLALSGIAETLRRRERR
jgi:polysaccharide biosynthesis protein PslH